MRDRRDLRVNLSEQTLREIKAVCAGYDIERVTFFEAAILQGLANGIRTQFWKEALIRLKKVEVK